MRALKILILEHNPFRLMALHQMLNAVGIYDVLTAPSLASALRSLKCRGPVDIAICDPQLKGGDGLALIRHLAVEKRARGLIQLGNVAPSLSADLDALFKAHELVLLGRLQSPVSAVLMRGLLDRYLQTARQSASA
ncbi:MULTISPECIES: response regulator [unclassified Pseudomonas]|uniref:response regulator n=1 Tax=unclassified Pseudomonas TaxID=196821 RepID=UPI000A1FB1D4|nr:MULTISPECIES: response regulator [unclassified Pseudomonas]